MTTETAFKLERTGLITTCAPAGQRNRFAYGRVGDTFACGKCHHELPLPGEPAIPTMMLFEEGRAPRHQSGAMPAGSIIHFIGGA